MDGDGKMMFEKETKKLKKLTEKLLREGDVTENEADWIYMFRMIYTMTRIKSGTPSPLSDEAYTALDQNFVAPFSPGSEIYEQVAEEFLNWYKAVYGYVHNEKSGNFISTIPSIVPALTELDIFSKNHLADATIRRIIKELPEEDGKIVIRNFPIEAQAFIPKGRLLATDVTHDEDSGDLFLSRYGLLRRMPDAQSEHTKEIGYLHKMINKLEHEDITEQEADNIYMILKFAQSMLVNAKNVTYPKSRVCSAKSITEGLKHWYKAVYKALRDGRTGNFVYTLPMNDKYNLGHAKRYITKSLEMLPKDHRVCCLLKGDVTDLPMDSFIAEGTSRTIIRSYRYGSIKRAGIDPDKYVLFPDLSGISIWWTIASKDDYFFRGVISPLWRRCIDEYSGKCFGFVSKLECLRKHGILPVGVVTDSNFDSNFVVFDETDFERCRHILEIPDKEIESLSPRVFSNEPKDIEKAIEGSIYAVEFLAETKKGRKEFLDEDEYIEVDR